MAKTTLVALLLTGIFTLSSNFFAELFPSGTLPMPASPQRSGDPAAGYNYLLYGDMVSSGIPLTTYRKMAPNYSPDDLGRSGDSRGIPFRFNVVEAPTA